MIPPWVIREGELKIKNPRVVSKRRDVSPVFKVNIFNACIDHLADCFVFRKTWKVVKLRFELGGKKSIILGLVDFNEEKK
uniref:hypothetical protein n=1 Tax=Bakuella subtropica TaxID=1295181 RepID=UPI0023F431AF|nr:hypothetical protein P4D19_mgp27 [Bakuella subtropica]WDY80874.1 hypothetical protein BKSUB_23 [Bakuella subtropica]